MKKFKLIIFLIMIILTFANCRKQLDNGKEITFVLEWTPNTNHTGLYVAQALGFYEEEGLNVKLVQPPEGDAVSLVASGRAQFGIGSQDTMAPAFASDQPLPVTAIATIIQHNTSGLVSQKEKGINRPKELENKTYATWDNPVEQAIIKNIVETDGGNYDKVKLIPNNVVDEVTAIKMNQVDAIWIFYGWGGIAMNVANLEVNYLMLKDINPIFDYYTPMIVAENNFLKNNPELVMAFLRATARGYEYAIENPEEAADILSNAVPELDREMVLASQKWISKEYKSDIATWGYIDPKRWNAFYNWLNENKLVNKTIPENTGFTNEFLPIGFKNNQ